MLTETTTTFILVGAIYLRAWLLCEGQVAFRACRGGHGLTILSKPAMLAFPVCVAVLIFALQREGR